jgi:GH35 family endo-1,4-beta-xylanase
MNPKHLAWTAAAVLMAALAASTTPAAVPETPTAPPPPAPVRWIKDAYAGKFPVGTAADLNGYSPQELDAIAKNYSLLMPENCMKPASVHPQENTWNWTAADKLVDFAQTNKMQVIGHVLVWHAGNPAWLFQNADGDAGKDRVTGRLKNHIQTEVEHFAGKVALWHVVNEAINDGGSAQTAETENLRNSTWLRGLGPEYLTLAFKFAHQADPKAQLYYNDYNIESGFKHDSSLLLLKRLLADGAPIHGVGIQGHWSAKTLPFASLEKALDDYQKLGLKVAISELDIALDGGDKAEALKAQAAAYRRLMELLLARQDTISYVVFYNLNDKRSWRSSQSPTLFDGQGEPKPAWQAVIDAATGKTTP